MRVTKIDDLLEKATGGNNSVPKGWVPATGIRPLLLDDPGLLWLKFHAEDSEEDFVPDSSQYAFLPFISKLGNAFEEKWMRELAPNAVRAMERDWDVRKVESLKRTLELMAQKTPVIAKASLWSAESKFYGCADSIWLTSELYRVFPNLKPDGYKQSDDGYVIVDMKYTSRLHTKDKENELIRYTYQMKIYSFALANMQMKPVKMAYLATRDRIFDPIPIIVNQEHGKPLDKELIEYRNKYLKIKLRGNAFTPWNDKEVEPNFSNKEDFPYHSAKERIQTELIQGKSLTILPGVGNKTADALEEKGFKSVADMLAKNPDTLDLESVDGIGKTTADRIRAVLRANKTKKATPVPFEIVPKKADMEFFVDMEFFSNVHVDMEKQWPALEGCEMVFLIGVGWNRRGKWNYRYFVAEEESQRSERKMFKELLAFLEEEQVFNESKKSVLYHWSDAEPTQTRRAVERYGGALKRLANLNWCDLLSGVFYKVPLAIPGAYKYGLKEIAAALSSYSPKHKVEWKGGLSSGQAAQVCGWAAYAQPNPLATKEMNMLVTYLESDVRSVSCILDWLRENAIQPKNAMLGGWYTQLTGTNSMIRTATPLSNGWYGKMQKQWE